MPMVRGAAGRACVARFRTSRPRFPEHLPDGDEHGSDRKALALDPKSDDVRSRPVTKEQSYHFKIERADGKTLKWSVDGREIHTWADDAPLLGVGHDHFGFNNWEIRTCFDNVKVTALP